MRIEDQLITIGLSVSATLITTHLTSLFKKKETQNQILT